MGKTRYLFIHCLATKEGRPFTGVDVLSWHTTSISQGGRGWKNPGYRRVLRLDGTWDELVINDDNGTTDPWEITNGVRGKNSYSEHWAYVGGLDSNGNTKDTRTLAQLRELARDVLEYNRKFPHIIIKGHNEVSGKDCPSFNVKEWLLTIGILQHEG